MTSRVEGRRPRRRDRRVTPGTPNGSKALITRITGQDGSYVGASLPAHRSGSLFQGQTHWQYGFNSDRATT